MSEIRSRLQGGGQGAKKSGSDQTLQKLGTGAVTGKQSIGSGAGGTGMSTTGGLETSANGKVITDLKNKSTGDHPGMSDIRKRLGAQGQGSGGTTTGDGDKSGSTSSKLGIPAGGMKAVSPDNATESTTLEKAKQGLGKGVRGGKLGTMDVKKTGDGATGTSGIGAAKSGMDLKNKLQMDNMKLKGDDISKIRFSDRLKSGELDKVAKGDIAQKLKLTDQFHMMDKGDVARRLDLEKHAAGGADFKNIHQKNLKFINNAAHLKNFNAFYDYRPYFHHGLVSPIYVNHCFKFWYYGPTFFAGVCWYPHWNPWVSWSWYYHCNPYWDPRPIWCRPIIYDPYYDWVWWQTPVWVSLPVVTSGTWVDVERPVIPEEQLDLQLLAVRFVDPGHPDEKIGTRFRAWVRNNSNVAIQKPFNVMLFAANDNKLTADLPHAGVRVTSIEAGDTQSFDIRLPLEVASMSHDEEGKPAPFKVLHVLVDANREIEETTKLNNGAAITRDLVLPVDPAAFEVDPSSVPVGGELVLAGEGLGPQPGQVLIHVAGQELQAEVLGWYDLGVRVNVPQVDLKGPTPAEIIVVRGDQAATNPINITITPGQAGPDLAKPSDTPN